MRKLSLDQTIYYKPKQPKPAALLIFDRSHKVRMVTLDGAMTLGRDYPASDRDIRVESEIVSRVHGEFVYDDSDGSYYYIDNNSFNGTFVNGEKLKKYNERGSKAVRLNDGDIIRIDRDDLTEPHPEAVLMIFGTTFSAEEKWKEYFLTSPSKVMIGRDEICQLRLSDLMASRTHAMLDMRKGAWYIKDNNSTNGVCVNGSEISRSVRLYPNDVIRIANTTLIFSGKSLLYNSSAESRASLIVDIKDRTVRGGRVLLKNIRAKFSDGDFVLILGGSGAGKTTLIKSMLGVDRANGKVILNGQDLYKNFRNLKSQIGMVPQFLALRSNDTVRHTLIDSADIKLGRKYTKQERIARVNEVLEHVGMTEHADKNIKDLSGGQQKKISVADQLIGFQKVFICDEPDSGLDAASRMQQMEILKEISQEGRIVMVISHEPDDAVQVINGVRALLFTKVLVLARSSEDRAGHLAFFGDVDSALAFFGVSRLQDIMLEINPPTEGGKGRADEYIEKYLHLTGGKK